MTERQELDHRDFEHDVVELALGEVTEPRRSQMLSHLGRCLQCRRIYADTLSAIDATVPVAPQSQPSPGFDLRVLGALGVQPSDGRVRTTARPGALTTRALLVAAALVLVVAAGVWGGLALLGGPSPTPLAADSVALHTDDGARVGTASVAWLEEERVLVVSVTDAPAGVGYTCRVVPATGEPQDLGHWESSPDGGTWVMHAPQGELDRIELVSDSGGVWSSARLP